MAINSKNALEDKNPNRSLCSSNASNLSSCRLIKINFSGRESCLSRRSNKVNNFKDMKSPYLTNDKVQLSRVTEKKHMHKKPTDIVSSYPLAVNLYKANSDEFKLTKADCKKVKKSVLTLPNEPARMPKMYTVSDLNDSEYFNDANDVSKTRKTKKRRSIKRYKKPRAKDPEMEYFDRDARYCSQLNIDLDCSSSEVINLNGNGEGLCKSLNKTYDSANIENNANDVWAILRNINKLQFKPSPPASQESVVPLRKRRPFLKKGNNRNDTRIIETCHTEEFSYISSYEFDSKSQDSCSPSSSFDRITVIDKKSEQDIMKQFSEQTFKPKLNFRDLKKESISKQNRQATEPRLQRVLQRKNKNDNKQIFAHTLNKKNLGVENITNLPNVPCVPKLQATEAKTSVTSIAPKNCRNPHKDYQKENGTLVTNKTNNLAIDLCYPNVSKRIFTKNPAAKFNASKIDFEKQLTGITRVVLSEGQDIVSAKLSEAPRKPRLALTLPNCQIPKMTQTEIKRRLANLKFPIVILGKDQLTNRGINVANCDPLHFNGLDEHIWPFMCEWSENKLMRNIQDSKKNEVFIKSKNSKVKHKISQDADSSANYLQKEVENYKKINSGLSNKNTHQYISESSSPKIGKPKPISILKSKMFQFLHTYPCPANTTENNMNKNKLLETKRDKIINVYKKPNENEFGYRTPICLPSKDQTKRPEETKILRKSHYSLKHPWAKTKWTSDFIENIIKKVRNGVYYGNNRREIKNGIDCTAVSTQTELNVLKNASCQNSIKTDLAPELILSRKDDPLKNIPGFDNALSSLEIETFSKSKIAVKHCITNIVVQFDVQVIAKTNNIVHVKDSLSCIPVHQKNNQEKVFKCNTSIRNETLPAELCTIIPGMMRILDANKKLWLPTATVEKVESRLTAISEFQGPELKLYSSYGFIISDQLRPMLNGHYKSVASNNTIIRNKNLLLSADIQNSVATLLIFDTSILRHLNKLSITAKSARLLNVTEKISKKPNQNKHKISNCMALEPYEPSKLALIPSTRPFNIIMFIKEAIDKYVANISNFNLWECNTYGHVYSSTINSSIIIPPTVNQPIVPFSPVNKIVVVSLFKAFTKMNRYDDDYVQNSNGTRPNSTGNKEKCHVASDKSKIELDSKDGKKRRKQFKVSFNKKSFVKCYRKCNSMSSISTYKSTPLSKITSLDEFCQALGSNALTSVLTGCLEKKILRAIDEMKNWIKDISPKQALLVLLLANKKETPNIIRLRSILLQGIAVNRITKAEELDTEIEVIEREKFNRLSQYEGITYLPASTHNQDNLLEELCWIAKTTASDYQKTFDKSSEKLLKSLLEKRKLLNPSYLRVMARYVGLGLLMPPNAK